MNNFLEILKTITFKKINIDYLSANNKLILDKMYPYNTTIIFSGNLIETNTNRDIQIFSKNIKQFLKVVQKNCKNFDPTILIKNFKITFFDIKKVRNKNETVIGGEVQITKDKIKYILKDFDSSFHELFHLSTIRLDEENDTIFVGFYLINADKGIGCGLNEGYTEYLSENYFEDSSMSSYFIEVKIAKILEKIIGKEKMEKYYFESDLLSLLNELHKYANGEEIIEFIQNLDIITEESILSKETILKDDLEILEEDCSIIFDFLFRCLVNKVNYLHQINLEDEYNNLIDFIFNKNEWISRYEVKGWNDNVYKKFKLYDENKFQNLIDEINNIINNKTK